VGIPDAAERPAPRRAMIRVDDWRWVTNEV